MECVFGTILIFVIFKKNTIVQLFIPSLQSNLFIIINVYEGQYEKKQKLYNVKTLDYS